MAELAPAAAPPVSSKIKKRWRAWLRAVHRDVGYLAIGFTVIYAISGIALNHIGDWDPDWVASERQLQITPVPAGLTDAAAIEHVRTAISFPPPDSTLVAGDEVHLTYNNGQKAVAIGGTVTIQAREPRLFFRIAHWLHATRGKAVWKYISDAYAVLLLYLAISGVFMIKGRLGFRWRGLVLITAGVTIPLAYIVLSGGPGAQGGDTTVANDGVANDSAATPDAGTGIRMLSPDENPPE
ncbi:MAG: hypothetical protein WKG01_12225 [Kofleriaceae bacterium]